MDKDRLNLGNELTVPDAGKRRIDRIIIHCSATPEWRDVKASEIKRWHVEERKWKDIGYHFVIDLDGTIERGRPLTEAGAHCAGHNATSVGICYIGGIDAAGRPKDTRTPAQRDALRKLVSCLRRTFPDATVHGHREFAPKACPSFDVSSEDW